MNYDRGAMKREVKDDLRQTRPRAVWVTLVFLLISYAAAGLLSWLQSIFAGNSAALVMDFQDLMFRLEYGMISERELAEYGMQALGGLGGFVAAAMLFGLITAAVNWLLQFGYQGYCLDVVRRNETGFARLFCGFPRLGWVLLTGLLIGLFTMLWAILFFVAAGVLSFVFLYFSDGAPGGVLAVLTVLAWIAAYVGLIAITLRYSMAYYILLDEKVDSLEAISRSKAMMRGRKWHFFVLQLSFIGWYLLLALIVLVILIIAVVIVGGVAAASMSPLALIGGMSAAVIVVLAATLPLLLWLQPYRTCACAKFYDWARHTDHADGVWEGTPPQAPDYPRYEEPVRAPEEPAAGQTVTPPAPSEPPRMPDDVPDRPDYE